MAPKKKPVPAPNPPGEKGRSRENKLALRSASLIGKKVTYRTKNGPATGVVEDVVSRAQAETKYNTRFSRSGRYVIIEGYPFPVRRTRCKVL